MPPLGGADGDPLGGTAGESGPLDDRPVGQGLDRCGEVQQRPLYPDRETRVERESVERPDARFDDGQGKADRTHRGYLRYFDLGSTRDVTVATTRW
ncbi:hypothetical protein RE9416_14810 [Prescottella equi]|nr:hypothetical protein RE9416_14810 [Prescottella equi]